MKGQSGIIIVGIVALVVGLALGLGGATIFGEKPAPGGIHNAETKVGDQAPEFELYDATGSLIALSDYRGKKNVVLAFYPAAWTPV